ncbi:hypothetical protein [Xanthocytophaga flava]|nr:hypothetical protein [Xanthocytophaga flavus]
MIPKCIASSLADTERAGFMADAVVREPDGFGDELPLENLEIIS